MQRAIIVVIGTLCSLLIASPLEARGTSALLAIDQNRTAVVDRIVGEWGDEIASSGQLTREEFRELLFAMRADRLLAARLAGSIGGLRDILAQALAAPATTKPLALQTKSLGDSADDVVYTPVTPCRLVETRGWFAAVYQGDGSPSHLPYPFAANEIRNYTATGANGVCLSQLPAGLAPSALQLQVFAMPTTTTSSGDVEVLAQGATFGRSATLVFLGDNAYTSASTAAPVNLANNQIAVQVRGGSANLAIDVVGYFRAAPAPIDPRFGVNPTPAAAGNGTQCTLGEIILNAGGVANGTPAAGQILPISQNTALFSLLGTMYGGNGTTTFALPDLRNAAPVGLTYSICTIGGFPARQ